MRALNDAKNRAQQGCAMQFSGITLRENYSETGSGLEIKQFKKMTLKKINDSKTSLKYSLYLLIIEA